MNEPLRIARYRPEWREDFARLNRQWIERYFRTEENDLKILGRPQEEIVDKGGEIFFALSASQVVGCCALVPHAANGSWELAKMAVDPAFQGRGAGYRLGSAVLDEARRRGATTVFLEANTRLEASIALYRKLGFRPVPAEHPAYARCNLYMKVNLT